MALGRRGESGSDDGSIAFEARTMGEGRDGSGIWTARADDGTAGTGRDGTRRRERGANVGFLERRG